MDKPLSAKDQKRLMEALEIARAEMRVMEAKEEAKRWAAIEVPLNLKSAFLKLTKYELSEIRIRWDVYGVSALNKQDLITALIHHASISLPNLLNKLDHSRYKIMRQLADHGGHGFVPMEKHQLDYFRQRGLIFSGTNKGKRILVMPQEVLECFQRMNASFREIIRRNSEWIRLTHGLLFYYGTLSFSQLDSMLERYTEKISDLHKYLGIIDDSIPFYQTVSPDYDGYSHIRVRDEQIIQTEQARRPNLQFYPCTKSQLLQAGEPDYIDRHATFRALVDFIMKGYDITRAQADELVVECVYAIRNGDLPNDLFEMLQTQLEMPDFEAVNVFITHLTALYHDTRQWFLKGYTPNEMSAAREKPATLPFAPKAAVIDFATKKIVGRNDPCPCGSGKKFKKCCGA